MATKQVKPKRPSELTPGLLGQLLDLFVPASAGQFAEEQMMGSSINPMGAMMAPVRQGVRAVMERFPLRGAKAETTFDRAANISRIRVAPGAEAHIPHELGHVRLDVNAPTTSRAYGAGAGREGGVINRIRDKQRLGQPLAPAEKEWLRRNEFRVLANEGAAAAATRGKDQTPELLNLMAYLQRMDKDNLKRMKELLVESIPGRVKQNTSDISQIARAILEFPQQSLEFLTKEAGTPAKVRKQVRDVLDMLMTKQDASKEFRGYLERNVKPSIRGPFRAGGGK